MPYESKLNEADARERLRAFWAGSSLGRPSLHVTAKNPNYVPRPYPPECEEKCAAVLVHAKPGYMLCGQDTDFLECWHTWILDHMSRSRCYLAEAMPGHHLFWGSFLATTCAMMGAQWDYHNSTAWIHPIPDILERPLPHFDPESPIIVKMQRCFVAAVQDLVSSNVGFVSPDICLDAATALSMLLTPEGACLQMVDRAERAKRWLDAVTDMTIAYHRRFYGLGKSLGARGDSRVFNTLMGEGCCDVLQCDFATMISEEMFGEFVMPGLRKWDDYLEAAAYHLDGMTQMRFLPQLATLKNLRVIQVNPEPAAPSPLAWLEALREIRRLGLSAYVQCWSVEEAIALLRELGPDGLHIVLPQFDSLDQALQAVEAFEK